MVCIDPKVNKRTDFKVSKHANDEGLCILVVISEDGSNPTTPLFHLDTREWLAKTHGCISQFLMFSSQWFTLFAMSVHLLKRIKHGMLIYISQVMTHPKYHWTCHSIREWYTMTYISTKVASTYQCPLGTPIFGSIVISLISKYLRLKIRELIQPGTLGGYTPITSPYNLYIMVVYYS